MRLDDANDSVRLRTCQVLTTFFNHIQQWYKGMDSILQQNGVAREEGVHSVTLRNEGNGHEEYLECRLDDVHWSTMIKTLGIHLDDTNEKIQVIVSLFV